MTTPNTKALKAATETRTLLKGISKNTKLLVKFTKQYPIKKKDRT